MLRLHREECMKIMAHARQEAAGAEKDIKENVFGLKKKDEQETNDDNFEADIKMARIF